MYNEKERKERKLHIGTVAKLYGVPISTLHYYEREGLLSPSHNYENNYSEYDMGEVCAELGDILFFRSIGVPVKDVKRIRESLPEDIRKILLERHAEIVGEIEALGKKLEAIEKKVGFIDEIISADPDKFIECEIPFNRAVQARPNDKNFLDNYLRDLNRFVVVGKVDENGVEEFNCIAVDDDWQGKGDIVFVKDKSARYMMSNCRMELYSRKFDLSDYIDRLKARGLKTEQYICQFLINLCDENGTLYDYYRVWFKVS